MCLICKAVFMTSPNYSRLQMQRTRFNICGFACFSMLTYALQNICVVLACCENEGRKVYR